MIKIFADGANVEQIRQLATDPSIRGFTTNPTLMRQAGVTDYEKFAREVLLEVKDLPVSFEVIADDIEEMHRQALKIASWGPNVYVKIPITTTDGLMTLDLIDDLSRSGIKVNVTAITTRVAALQAAVHTWFDTPAIISIFAGRIADTGRDPVPVMKEIVRLLSDAPNVEVLWASPREVLNVYQAEECGCHIITATPDILKKLGLRDKDLDLYSLDTVRMFYRDAVVSGFTL